METWSFQTLRERLLDKTDFSTVTDPAKTFIGAAALLPGGASAAPAVNAAGGVGAILQALSEREKLADAGKILGECILKRRTTDYSGRVQRGIYSPCLPASALHRRPDAGTAFHLEGVRGSSRRTAAVCQGVPPQGGGGECVGKSVC